MPKLGRVDSETRGRVKPTQPTPVKIVSAVKNTTQLTVTFDQPVVLKGVPQYTTSVAGATPVSASNPTLNQVVIVFSATIAAATTMTIPFPDPAVRSKDGGYVVNSTFPVT